MAAVRQDKFNHISTLEMDRERAVKWLEAITRMLFDAAGKENVSEALQSCDVIVSAVAQSTLATAAAAATSQQ